MIIPISRSGPCRSMLSIAVVVAIAMAKPAAAASFTDFESGHPVNATINGQTGKNIPYGAHAYGSTWTVVDEWGNGRITDANKADYDERVVDDGTGNLVWRLSNGVADTGYSDQPNTPSAPEVAGEMTTGAGLWNDRGGNHTAPAGPYIRATPTTRWFNFGLRFRSATGAAQPGLVVRLSAEPRQSSWRVTWLEILDTGQGLTLSHTDVDAAVTFPLTVIAANLSYTEWHTVDVFIEFKEGLGAGGAPNDIVRTVVDGKLVHTGTTWETYYASLANPRKYAVDAVMFRQSTAAASVLGGGLYIDDVLVDNQPYPVCGDSIVSARPAYVTDGAGEQCDDGDSTNGSFGSCCSTACTFEPVTTACSDQAGPCDIADHCTGTGATCPDEVEPDTTVCREAAGVCDQLEYCDGTAKECPSDTLVASGTECRATAGVCDPAEECTGDSVDCPGDALEPAETECRASVGVCDAAENCTGDAVDCPVDSKVAEGTTCRVAVDLCDFPEACTGSTDHCPEDVVQPADYVCREATGPCDSTETCTGAANQCPVDAVEPILTPCPDDEDICTDDHCDEAGTCVHPPIPLAPLCNYAVVGGSDTRSGLVRTRNATTVQGSVCADRADIGDVTAISAVPGEASLVLLQDTGNAATVRPNAVVANGSVVTGGGCVAGLRNAEIFGATYDPVCCANSPVPLPGGVEANVIDACGLDPRVADCAQQKALVPLDIAYLNALPSTDDLGVVTIGNAETRTIAVGAGLSVIDIDRIRMDENSRLVIDAQGNEDAVVVLRLARGLGTRMKAVIEGAGGLTASRLLLYASGGSCLVGYNNVGSGTLFCPDGKVKVFMETTWVGAIAGGAAIDLGWNVHVVHQPFLGLSEKGAAVP